MTYEELISKVQRKGCLVERNGIVRDACGHGKLIDSVCGKIREQLKCQDVALGSDLTSNQDDYVLLYDNRKESDIRKLIELAVSVKSGEAVTMCGGCPAAAKLPLAAAAAFKK